MLSNLQPHPKPPKLDFGCFKIIQKEGPQVLRSTQGETTKQKNWKRNVRNWSSLIVFGSWPSWFKMKDGFYDVGPRWNLFAISLKFVDICVKDSSPSELGRDCLNHPLGSPCPIQRSYNRIESCSTWCLWTSTAFVARGWISADILLFKQSKIIIIYHNHNKINKKKYSL